MASIASLWAPALDAASGKIPILSDSSVEEASPAILSSTGKKGNEERQEFCGKSPRVILHKNVRFHSAKTKSQTRTVHGYTDNGHHPQ